MPIEIDGFEVDAEIGRGGFGVVYRARQLDFNRLVAIKVLHPGLSDEKLRKQFATECRAVGALRSHRNILGVYSTGTTVDGRPYLAMQLLTGGSLSERIPLPVDQVRELGIRLAGALEVAHEGGVVHRDVKPSNVLFNEDGEPVLVDFGISSLVTDPSTTTSSIAVSIGYTAPEVLDGVKPAVAADVYALGATLFAATTGRTPFVIEGGYSSLAVVAARILTKPVEDLRPAGVPEWLCRVIETAMAKDPTVRYRTMAELRAALEQSADETIRVGGNQWRTIDRIPPADLEPTKPARRRRRFGRGTIVIGSVLALLVLATAVTFTIRELTGSPGSPGSLVAHDRTDVDCNRYDDLLAVGTDGDIKDTLLLYGRGKIPGNETFPTHFIATNGLYTRENPHFSATRFVSLVLPGDMIGDGSPDLVGETPDGSLWLMPGDCSGMFRAATKPSVKGSGEVQLAAPGDITGDGRPDLLAVDEAKRLVLYKGEPHGHLDPGKAMFSGWTSAIAVGDVNGDGAPDVLDRRADGSLLLHEGKVGGGLQATGVRVSLRLPPGEFPYVIGGVDVSLGPHDDLLAIDRNRHLVAFLAASDDVGNLFQSTCHKLGNGWADNGITDVAGSAAVPGAPAPRFGGPTQGHAKCTSTAY